MAKQRFNGLRASLGLSREPNLIRAIFYSQQMNLALFPDWFVPWFKGRLPNTVLTDFPLYERDDELPAHLQAFLSAGDRPIVFANASWRSNLGDYFHTAQAACEALGRRGIFVTGGMDPAPPSSSSFFTVDYAPYKRLLPYAAALVHHGGIGTMARAMAEGTPQMLIPYTGDQPFNAKQASRLGIGLTVPERQFEAKALPTLGRLLSDDRIASRCREVAARFGNEPNFEKAAEHIERLIKDSRGAPQAKMSTREEV
jgi:UDP:flavonoid glycosyltransferase YjiC (YdhE family)